MRRRKFAIVLLVGWLVAPVASAHEVRPAYLELHQTTPESYDVYWKVPALGDHRLSISVVFPGEVVQLAKPRGMFWGDAYIERWAVQCLDGLDGREIRIEGLESTRIDVLARIENLSGRTQTARLLPSAPTFTVIAEPSILTVAYTYFMLGVEHILLGIDHLLFVLALLLLVNGIRSLVATITAFTLAHSITLVCAALGWVEVPGAPVEACIALSIVFVAREILYVTRGRASLTARHPWLVAFTFGLLHGLGFAGALSDIGLPESAIYAALFFFNIGVEAGQLAFVAVAMAVMGMLKRVIITLPFWMEPFPAYAIGGCAAFWIIQRMLAF